MGLDFFLVERFFRAGISHLVTVIVGVAGVLAFSSVIFAPLASLQGDRANTERLRQLADALEQSASSCRR